MPDPRISLKFRDTVTLPYADDIGPAIDQQTGGEWTKLTLQFPGIRIRRTFRFTSQDDVQKVVDRVVANNPSYHPPNFFTLFVVTCPTVPMAQDAAKALAAWPIVEYAVPQETASSPTSGLGGTGLNLAQGYEDNAPVGIGARCAWDVDGGDGRDQEIIDIEKGWSLDHLDFVTHHPKLLFGKH